MTAKSCSHLVRDLSSDKIKGYKHFTLIFRYAIFRILLSLGLVLSLANQAMAAPVTQLLIEPSGTLLWTKNARSVPMCWHELLKFPTVKASNDAKAFVAKTIVDGWISLLNLRISWVNCPTSGNEKHVRIKLRTGDPGYGGTTIKLGMETLSTAAQRIVPPPKDPPGLLMGFPADWNKNAQTRATFRSLILHEFGHILGFGHEQLRPDGPQGISCYKNPLPNAFKIGPADPQSIMGWSYCKEALGVLTFNDISSARSVYGRFDTRVMKLHTDGSIWSYIGKPCNINTCLGWALIDRNVRSKAIVGGSGRFYQLHVDGKIWSWDGHSRCNSDACPGWTEIDHNVRTRDIIVAKGTLFQRHVDGKIWKWDGKSNCTKIACPGWTEIDRNGRTKAIAGGPGGLYQLHVDGKIWKWNDKSSCTANACPGWTEIDHNARTSDIVVAKGTLFQRHIDGRIWKWDGQSSCTVNACPGWIEIDRNGRTKTIVGSSSGLYQLHVDGKIWKWDGISKCTVNACPGWTEIDHNTRTVEIIAAGTTLLQRHLDGKIWIWNGLSSCTITACPGWTVIDRNIKLKAIASGYTQ